MKKRLFVGLLVGAAVFASAYGVAASLGTLTADNLGAAGQDVATCDSDGVTASWDTAYVAGSGFEVTDVTLSNVNSDCDGSDVTVLLSDSADAELGSVDEQAWPAATTDAFDFTSQNISASDVYGIDVLIDGNAVDVTP